MLDEKLNNYREIEEKFTSAPRSKMLITYYSVKTQQPIEYTKLPDQVVLGEIILF